MGVSHSFTKICIFYTADNMDSVKNSYHIGQLIGLKINMLKTNFFIMLVVSLSLLGVPTPPRSPGFLVSFISHVGSSGTRKFISNDYSWYKHIIFRFISN